MKYDRFYFNFYDSAFKLFGTTSGACKHFLTNKEISLDILYAYKVINGKGFVVFLKKFKFQQK